MTEEVPDKTSGRLKVPVSVIVYNHKTDHRFFILVKLPELDSDVLALASMDGRPVLKCESESRINRKIQIAGHRHSIVSLLDTPHIEVRIAFPIVFVKESDSIIMCTNDRTETNFDIASLLNGFIHQWLAAVSIITESVS